MLSRRQFIQQSSLVSLYPIVPSMLGRVAQAAAAHADARTLVVIQLDGGNDGINTVVPFGDDQYARHRDKLRLDATALHKLNDHVGLHPQMRGMKELFDDGRLTIVQGVGYPNPSRSHFQSMKIWQTACVDLDRGDSYGWLGRTLDRHRIVSPPGAPGAFYVGDGQTPVALWGRRAEVASLARLDDFKLPPAVRALAGEARTLDQPTADPLRMFVTQQVLSAYATADQLERRSSRRGGFSTARYPATKLGQHLEVISQLIQSDAGARVYYTSQSGYDTHAAQLYTHAQLLRELADALLAFLNDLKAAGLDDRVLVLAFSEFGRRVEENASLGTDHGTAGPVFLAGSAARGGLLGQTPNLANLDSGDIKSTADFRQIYAAILEDWLDVDAESILQQSFPKTPIFQT